MLCAGAARRLTFGIVRHPIRIHVQAPVTHPAIPHHRLLLPTLLGLRQRALQPPIARPPARAVHVAVEPAAVARLGVGRVASGW